jgi:hypothetical protein
MATEAKIIRAHSAASGPPRSPLVKESRTEDQRSVHVRESEPLANEPCDFFLLHNRTDGSWTTKLAERVSGASFGKHDFRLSLTDWNSARGADTSVEMGEILRGHRLLGIVVSRAMSREDWPAAQRTIEFLKELAAVEGRIVTILKENVTIPPLLRFWGSTSYPLKIGTIYLWVLV